MKIIVCAECGYEYFTRKDSKSKKAEDRPQCKKCGERVK